MAFTIKSFEDYLDRTARCKTAEELFEVFLLALKRHGIDRAMFGLLTDHDDIGEKAGIGIVRNYPDEWMAHYYASGLDQVDPVAVYALNQPEIFKWDDIEKNMKMTPFQEQGLRDVREAGLYNGLGISFRGIGGQIAGMGLATSQEKDSFDGRVDLITAYCNHFYLRYRQLKRNGERALSPVNLTEREREVLTWAAMGKSNADIATILTVSVHTIDFHMRNIFKKLKAPSRVVAIVKAITMGLIFP